MARLTAETRGRIPLPALGREIEAIRARFAEGGALGLIVVDLSAIDEVERSYGADAHRQLAGRVAGRVRETLAPELADDTFVVLADVGPGELLVLALRPRQDRAFYCSQLPELAQQIDETLQQGSQRLGYPFTRERLTLPVGYAIALHDPTRRPEALLWRARLQAREEAAFHTRAKARARREALVSLLFSEGIHMVFEPIVSLTRREILGFEALVRGEPGSELATPAALFAAAREVDMAFELDCLCRRVALREAKRLPPGSKLFLNCLPSAIHDPAFEGEALQRSLQDHRLRPNDVVFEISERESIDNFSMFREACDHYSRLGFQIALDDIGVGYGTLESVTELQPNYIKIDIAFVRGIDSDPARQEVLRAMNSIARRIGAHIIAEGIESPEQLESLRRLAIPYGQGYLLGSAFRPGVEA